MFTTCILVAALQENAQLRLEDLAKLVRMVPSSVHERLQLLAFIGVRSSKPCSKLMPHIDPIDAIEEAHSVAGAYGLMLKVRALSSEGRMSAIMLTALPIIALVDTNPCSCRYRSAVGVCRSHAAVVAVCTVLASPHSC